MSENSLSVPRHILASMLLGAFRYALGRRTYITGTTADWLQLYWPLMERWHKQIQDDIRRAIAHGDAGDACDVKEWQRVLDFPVKAE